MGPSTDKQITRCENTSQDVKNTSNYMKTLSVIQKSKYLPPHIFSLFYLLTYEGCIEVFVTSFY